MTTKGERTRNKILEKSAAVFVRKGFLATSINDILQASGVTKGSLYFHFSGKEEIGIEVLKREKDVFLLFLDEVLNEGPPVQGLSNFFRAALDKHRQQNFIGGCVFGNVALEASDTSPELTAFVAGVFDEWIKKMTTKIDQIQKSGEMRKDIPARDLAEMVVATVEGGIMQSRLLKSARPLQHSMKTMQKMLELQA